MESFPQFVLQFFIMDSLYTGKRSPSVQQWTTAFMSLVTVVLSMSKFLIPQRVWSSNEKSTFVKIKKSLWVICLCNSILNYFCNALFVAIGYFIHIHPVMPPFTQNFMYLFIAVRVLHETLKWSWKVKSCVDTGKKMQLDFLMNSFGFFLDFVGFTVGFYVLCLPHYPFFGIGGVVMLAILYCFGLFLCLVFAFAAFNVSRLQDILDLDLMTPKKFCPTDMLLGLSLIIHLCLVVSVPLCAPTIFHN